MDNSGYYINKTTAEKYRQSLSMCAKKCFSGYSETDLTPSESFCIDACADLYIKSQEICSKAYGDYTQETLKLLPKK